MRVFNAGISGGAEIASNQKGFLKPGHKYRYHCDQFSIAPLSNFMRRLLAVIFLLSVFCQAFAVTRQVVVLDHEGSFEVSHAQMHIEGAAHHHDEHGMAHQDDSKESILHILSDAGPSSVALIEFPQLSLHFDRPPAPAMTAEAVGPSPYLDGLRRPPRLTS